MKHRLLVSLFILLISNLNFGYLRLCILPGIDIYSDVMLYNITLGIKTDLKPYINIIPDNSYIGYFIHYSKPFISNSISISGIQIESGIVNQNPFKQIPINLIYSITFIVDYIDLKDDINLRNINYEFNIRPSFTLFYNFYNSLFAGITGGVVIGINNPGIWGYLSLYTSIHLL